ncbi:MAG: cysteine desulfurase [Phycisphaeraceae bacterium]|nr:cysteine desulfurase [Phycisphaeraceae bacterium]
MQWIYLDNNATTKPDAAVTRRMMQALEELWANASSVHRMGQMVRQQMELSRAALAALIGAPPRQLVLTSGGTEANNLALRGILTQTTDVLITPPTEHAAIREPAEALSKQGHPVQRLLIDGAGRVSPKSLDDLLALVLSMDPSPRRVLVSVQWANNETGVIQPIAELSRIVQSHSGQGQVLLHVDATQAVGKIPVDVGQAGVHLLTFSAHKFHGPKGVGALYVGPGVRLQPQILGGPQERQKRGGTENSVAILGAGVAAELAQLFLADLARVKELTALRDRLEQGIRAAIPDAVVNGVLPDQAVPRLWNTTNIGFPKLESEAILVALSEKGLCASAGAACSSGSLDPSPVLLAMGVPPDVAHGSIRLSLSRMTTEAEIDAAIALIVQVVEKLRKQTAQVV